MNKPVAPAQWLKRTLIALGLWALMAAGAPGSLGAEIEDELAQLPTETSILNTGVMFKGTSGGFMESALFARYPNDSTGKFRIRTCTSVEDVKCDDATSLYYNTFLPLCQSGNDFDCVEKFVAKKEGGGDLPTTFDSIQPSPSLSPYKPDASRNLVGPGQSLVFTIPGA